MARFVELPSVSERGSTIWVNPDHIVAVEDSHQEGKCWLMSEQGCRFHVDLSQVAAVACLHELDDEVQDVEAPAVQWLDDEVDLRDSVRENLNR